MPASWTDYPDRYPDFRLGQAPSTPYPSMLPVLVAVMAVAGLVAAVRPAAARSTSVVAALAALQVGGIAVVAHQDWWNLAGADGASYRRAAVGSLVAMGVAAAAAVAAAVSVLLYRTGPGEGRPSPTLMAGSVAAGVVAAVVVPLWLCAHWGYTSLTAAGQFALWWSLPWGIGLVAAGTLRDRAARRAAALSVFAFVLLAAFCVAAPTFHGFGVRLPD
ncbi:hypothetical protein [Actinoplanes sp. NPDC049681]|uniref:hypothetical protein n=1 Tax=Actinoplanes sp. NPDC049681 TaxID=3363905 RepID=UPI0037B760C9